MQGSVGNHIGDWIGEGWRMFAEQWQTWVVNALVYFGLLTVPMIPIGIFIWLVLVGSLAATQGSPDAAFGAIGLIVIVELGAVLVLWLVVAFFSAGMHRAALKQLRGEKVQVSDLFSGGHYFLRVAGASFLIGVLTLVGFLMCFIPALLVGGVFFFTVFIIVDRDCGVIEAMRASYDRCRESVWWFTLFALILMLINQAVSSVCSLGLVVTYPLILTIGAVAYRDCFEIQGMRGFQPKNQGNAAAYNAVPPSFMPPPPPPPPGTPPPGWGGPSPYSPGPEPQGALCPSCAKPIATGARFCPSCGSPISNPPGGGYPPQR